MHRIVFVTLLLAASVTTAAPSNRPNFLIIMADDCTYNDLPLYGGQNAQTPHINALARRGLTFNQAYVSSAMCQPCRAELFTGRYPLSNGCCWNHSASRPTVQSLPHLLRPLGYRVGIAGKVHVEPASAFPFDAVAGFDSNCVRNPTQTHNLQAVRDYISTTHDTPFCLVIALVEPHVPWVMGDASQYPPGKISLPANLADTPMTRRHFANYLAEITYMDGQVGEILQTLDDAGATDNTVVLFTSEQGAQFPGCKWTNWNTGVHTALIAAWPGHFAAGKRTDALVQYADVAPTLLELAHSESVHAFDGTSFARVLKGNVSAHRDYAFAMHNNLPEGPRYPIRSVTDGEWHYLRNLLPQELYIEQHLMGGGRLNNPYWATWVGIHPKRVDVYDKVKRYMLRPAEQLYHTTDDPYELHDLATSPQHQEIKARLSTKLDDWLKSQHDPGAEVDTMEALEAARRGEHLH
ncbi:MAG: sulfatase [Planctomycetales bacterium]|nr:sulfatase [Planctomycetales bacterium]